jgi:hypothetical protein
MVDKSFSRRLKLNSAILKNKYWFLPVDDKGHSNYEPVGRGIPSSSTCGKWVSLSVCKNREGHKGEFLGIEDATNKVVVRHRHLWCHKSSCPICFVRGWSLRGARNIKGRLDVAIKRGLGKVEHVVVSVSLADRDLSESVMRKKCRDALFDRGVSGGCMIFHGYSMDRERGVLKWSPHYHVLGFILGGFDRCRQCVHVREDCRFCSGFKGREVRGYAKDGYLVKVLREREKSYYSGEDNVFGTAFYQLHHATIRLGVKRFHAVTWFGSCANRKFSGEKSMSEDLCPVCGEEMSRAVYVGKRRIIKNVGHADYKAVFLFDEFDEDGQPYFIDVIGSRGG